jgi:hypothetical protein
MPLCRRAQKGQTELDILSEMGRGTSLDMYLTSSSNSEQRSIMDLDLMRTVAAQVLSQFSIYRMLHETDWNRVQCCC